ncbi:MAG: AAA domain-containing protein, partial [Nakamurella sp.]
SSFRPTAIPPFDVLIIDEASQIGFEALPLLALSASTIVVGDDKQTSPEHVGLDRARIFDLMDDYLREIPRYRTVFDPDRSLYDLATLRFSTPVMLTEHFRCLPEIIAFSNHQAYGDQIVPLRDQSPHPGWVPLGLVRVLDGYRSGFVNEPEALQIVSLIQQMCDDPQYDGMTFGVISLLGTQQSKLIWELLYDRLGPDLVAQRQIRCGEPANFQGDERDVMVLSTVVAVDPSRSSTRFSAMTGTAALRRINVAASRARNQMWVVTSVDSQSLPVGDLRAELIRHCAEPPAAQERTQDVLAACESEFERRVVRSLQARGYRAIQVQHKVGQYRLDIVVAGPDGRLAIECDGDRWHGEDVWHKDRARQEVLERAGWTFERIRGSSFFRDPDRAMEPVWARLERLGIPTGDDWIVNSPRGVTREVTGIPDRLRTAATAEPEPGARPATATTESAPTGFTPPTWYSALEVPDAQQPAMGESGGETRPTNRTPANGSGLLRTFTSWPSRPLPSIDSDDSTAVLRGLAEIIKTEGPMHALQVYQRYAKASGADLVEPQTHRHFDVLNVRGVRGGHWLRVKDRISDPSGATLYAPGSPSVVLRIRGPGEFTDIPRSEIRTLMEALGMEANPTELKRAVLRELGVSRMTEQISDYLDQCLRYTWTT